MTSLVHLSLNQNPLGTIPPFNDSKIRSLALVDTLLISAEFPLAYTSSFLQTISISNNKIHAIKENDFDSLKHSKIKRLHIDSASISTIHPNAFIPLMQLQSLSLQNNQLKSCEFLSTFRLLSSVHLDGNQFTSLPQQLSTPGNIKDFFFTNNLISVIDDSSPLDQWVKRKYTNIKLRLVNNTFDCCQSIWFIRFLNSSSHFIPDAPLLTCATPATYAGRKLITLNPNEMDCSGIEPKKPWWPIALTVILIVVLLAAIVGVAIYSIIKFRNRRSRSGYTDIAGNDTLLPNPPVPPPTQDLPFPPYGEDNDNVSTYSTAPSRQTAASHVPSNSTYNGVSVNATD